MTKLRSHDEHGNPYGDNLFLDEGSGCFIWRERIGGRNHWRSTRAKTVGLARQRVKEFRAQATGQPTERLRRTFDEAFDVVMKIQAGKGKKTHVMAKTQIEGHLRPWFQSECAYLSDFEAEFEETWARYKNDQESLTPGRKLEHDRRHLLMALKRAKEKGWMRREFKKRDLQLMEATEPVGRILEDEELEWLMPEVGKHETLNLQVRMALLMGMRLREILHLSWEEVDFRRGIISIKGGRVKTRVARVVPIHSEILPMLRDRKKGSQGPYVFPARHTNQEGQPFDYERPQDDNSKSWEAAQENATEAAREAFRKSKKDPDDAPKIEARFHDLRHTAISFMILDGIPDQIVSKVTGASLTVIKRVYLHLNLDMTERLRNLRCGKFVGTE